MAEIVTTRLGKVKGKVVKLKDGNSVNVYRNIPFAKPPLGKLRFMPPQPAEPWEGVRDGTIVGKMPLCLEGLVEQMEPALPMFEPDSNPLYDEDCLHISVYAPQPKRDRKLPVMLWIYGGGFMIGNERGYGGSVLAGMNDVVVVIPNYRVGVFGFLSLGPESPCTGNAGLLDQQMAMRWVQENIENFGGDKNNVTIFGESAGGVSCHLNVLSPLAKGLFHKAINHSGTAAMPGLVLEEDSRRKCLNLLLEHLNIEADNDDKLLEILQNLPSKELIDAMGVMMGKHEIFFAPTVGGKVIPKPVVDLLKEKKFAKVPSIFGINNTEGHGILTMFSGKDFSGGFTEEEAKKAIFFPLNGEAYELCKKEYLCEDDGQRKFSKFAGDLVGAAVFTSPAIQCATFHSEVVQDTYCYYGAFQLRMHHDPKCAPEIMKKADWCICDHGDEIYMTFGVPFSQEKFSRSVEFSEEEENLSRAFMTYLTNFAKTGDPNKGEKVGIQWPKYKRGGEHLVVANPFTTKQNVGEKETKFWTEVMPSYIKNNSV